ncbi:MULTISPECIES: membrane protein insertion efficiency factor YidD [Fischerella]|uniref:Membrane protein insertion efficiency factor YidD n=1 Tax=Fischerella muscicola CCMEE 5323 TaxID=2019572 RepID=A0A2N6K7S7_FISMU|nr:MULTISPECIES: membrane protein insertion efficiency factor YidD [Fischerella]MBD2430048.1 membrane protein insertion efficiency factor YidD [Fischerella sp. FACHB-380]PLZ93358.1 membrane protein insertion efficiency factor YidD [Fischerella muscicola CCMEE 5323]
MQISLLDSLSRKISIIAITGYQKYISPHKGFACAHRVLYGGESCSGYIKRVIATEGLQAGLLMSRDRFAACKQASQILFSCQRVKTARAKMQFANSESEEEDEEDEEVLENTSKSKRQSSSIGKHRPNSSYNRHNNCDNINCDSSLQDCSSCPEISCDFANAIGDLGNCDCNLPECGSFDCSGADCGSLDCGSCGN